MTKEKRLKEIIDAIKYIAKVDDEIALGYAGVFEEIADRWAENFKKKNKIEESKIKQPSSVEFATWISELDLNLVNNEWYWATDKNCKYSVSEKKLYDMFLKEWNIKQQQK